MNEVPIASLAWFATCMFMFGFVAGIVAALVVIQLITSREYVLLTGKRKTADAAEKRSKAPLGASGSGSVGELAEGIAARQAPEISAANIALGEVAEHIMSPQTRTDISATTAIGRIGDLAEAIARPHGA
jgi:hypothetical protein